jgi:hypothetical protein
MGKPMEGQVRHEHQRSRPNSTHGNKGGINHLESHLAQQELDSQTHLLGSQKWTNCQILGGCVATGTHNGKSGQGGGPTGNDSARKNKNPSLLEAKK